MSRDAGADTEASKTDSGNNKQPVRVSKSIGQVAVGGEKLFVASTANGFHDIVSVNKDGTKETGVAETPVKPGDSRIVWMSVIGPRVLFATNGTGIYSAPSDGSGVVSAVYYGSVPASPAFTNDGNVIAWLSNKYSLQGSVAFFMDVSIEQEPREVQLTGTTHAIGLSGSTIYSSGQTGATQSIFLTNIVVSSASVPMCQSNGADSLAFDDSYVYWVNSRENAGAVKPGAISRILKNKWAASTTLVRDIDAPSNVYVSDGYVYWASGLGENRAIYRVNTSTLAKEIVAAPPQPDANYLTGDSGYVYWANMSGDNAGVWRLEK